MGNSLSTLWHHNSATSATPQSLADLTKSASGTHNATTTATTLLQRGDVVSRAVTLSSIETSDPSIPPKHRCPFLELPVEIRAMVYCQVSVGSRIYLHGKSKRRGKTRVLVDDSELQDSMHLLATCKTVYQEAWAFVASSTLIHASGAEYRLSDLAPYMTLRVLPHIESLEFLQQVHLKPLLKMPKLKNVEIISSASVMKSGVIKIRTPVALSFDEPDERIVPLLAGTKLTALMGAINKHILLLISGSGRGLQKRSATLKKLAARGVVVACTLRFLFHVDIKDGDFYAYHEIELGLRMDFAAYRVTHRQMVINGQTKTFSKAKEASEYLRSTPGIRKRRRRQ